MLSLNTGWIQKHCSYPGPELLIKGAGYQAALKEDANPVVVMGDCSIF